MVSGRQVALWGNVRGTLFVYFLNTFNMYPLMRQ